jgi:hypothetical protein
MMECGQKLNAVKKEIDLFQQLAKTHSHPVLATYMQWYQDTITITPLCVSRSSAVFPIASAEECKITDAKGIQLIMFMMPACYLGQHERVQFLAKNGIHMITINRLGCLCTLSWPVSTMSLHPLVCTTREKNI